MILVKSSKIWGFGDGDYVFYPGTSGALIVFDLNDNSSLQTIDNWFEELRSRNIKNLSSITLIGNKSDLSHKVNNDVIKQIVNKWQKIYEINIPY